MKKLKDKKGIALMPLIIIIAVLLIGAGIVLFTLIFNSNEKGKSNTLDNATGDIGENSNSSLKVGDYVEYDVSYTDVYTDYNFTSKDGWRVLDPGVENEDGTFSGVKLISTGLPANLYYYYSDIKSKETDKTEENEGTVGLWAGNPEQRKNYLELFKPTNRVESDNNIYAAAGLCYNFELIEFTLDDDESVKNEGEYKKIGTKTSEEISGKEFKIEGIAEEVHNLTLKELNEARGESETSTAWVTDDNDTATGLFYLIGLKEFGYNSGMSSCPYWLASPDTNTGSSSYLWFVDSSGDINYNSVGAYGIRPVVSLKAKIQIEKIER